VLFLAFFREEKLTKGSPAGAPARA
jgi:hypothetical protein